MTPPSHFHHLRDTTASSESALSRETALAMVFKLARSAETSWRRLNGKRCRRPMTASA
jgi:hypothetical protein